MSEPNEILDEKLADWFPSLLRHRQGESQKLNMGLITYGSLLHPEELEVLFHRSDQNVFPVRVEGYTRRFSKSVSPHLRTVNGPKSGVLNLHSSDGNWFNGLLVGPLSLSGLRKYAFREREYDITDVRREHIEFYESPPAGFEKDLTSIYTCRLEDLDESDGELEPVPAYLDLCLEGAREWGETFFNDFIRTTRVKDRSLKKYI